LSEHSALYWHWLEENAVQCDLCPHFCRLHPGKTGLCNVRTNQLPEGLVSLNYGMTSSVAIDPVEKKPLYHWKPGSRILSIGSVGCNMACPFCQNWPISTWSPSKGRYGNISLHEVNPQELVHLAETEGLLAVAFTYNEPLVSFEFVLDAAKTLKIHDLSTVIVSNGLICHDPLDEIASYIDAANIDIKAFTDLAYRTMGGNLDTVLHTIESLFRKGVHLELTHLVVPGINDRIEEFREMTKWISSFSDKIPLHISRYFPHHKWTEPPTNLILMKEFDTIAREYLKYVYMGNVSGESITRCWSCGNRILTRTGYSISEQNIDNAGKCKFCGAENGIVI